MKVQNKTFLITGGSSGLGLGTAKALLQKGANVSIIDLKAPLELNERLFFNKADVRNESEILTAINETIKEFGQIDGVINCAGIGPPKRVVGKEGPHPLDFFKNVIDINLVGTFNVIRLAVNAMQQNEGLDSEERGIVISTASVAAFDGQIGQAAYSASKGGVVAMTLPMAREFARMGIRVMCIAPGIFETPLLAALPQEAQDSLGQQVPFPKRLGSPAEYASLTIQIIENQMLNGETIRLDGSIRMGSK